MQAELIKNAHIIMAVITIAMSVVFVLTSIDLKGDRQKDRIKFYLTSLIIGTVSAIAFVRVLMFFLDTETVCAVSASIAFTVVLTILMQNTFKNRLYIILILYAAAIIYITLLVRIGKPVTEIRIDILNEVKSYFTTRGMGKFRQLSLNIALFIPLGAALKAATERTVFGCVVTGAVVSSIIESTQLLMSMGECDLIDIAVNTLGAFLGAVICAAVIRHERKSEILKAGESTC